MSVWVLLDRGPADGRWIEVDEDVPPSAIQFVHLDTTVIYLPTGETIGGGHIYHPATQRPADG